MPSLAFVEPVVSVPSCDLFVFVVLNFEHHAGFEDELAAAIFEERGHLARGKLHSAY